MQYDVPDMVSLAIGSNDTQLGFVLNVLKQAAWKAGLPLLEQDAYADFILQLPLNQANRDSLLDIRLQKEPIKFRILWKDGDPSPDDKTNEIQDWEFDKKRNKLFNFYLNDYEKDELKKRQVYYQLYGGIIGSGKEIPLDTNIIIIDLNIVYDRDQYTLQEAIEATKIPVEDMKGAYRRINVEFNVTYSAGKGDPSYVNSDGAYGKIAEGFKNKAINVLLFLNNQYRGHKGSLYNWRTQQIFVWEGTSADKPITKRKSEFNIYRTRVGAFVSKFCRRRYKRKFNK